MRPTVSIQGDDIVLFIRSVKSDKNNETELQNTVLQRSDNKHSSISGANTYKEVLVAQFSQK